MSLTASWMISRGMAWDGPYTTDEIKVMRSQGLIENDTLLANGNNPKTRRFSEWQIGGHTMCDNGFGCGFNGYSPWHNAHAVEIQRMQHQHDKDMLSIQNQRLDVEREREFSRRKAELDAETIMLPYRNAHALSMQDSSNRFQIEQQYKNNRHDYEMDGQRNRHEIACARTSSAIRIDEYNHIEYPRYKDITRPSREMEHRFTMERIEVSNSQSLKIACVVAVAMAGLFVAGLTFMAMMPGFWNR